MRTLKSIAISLTLSLLLFSCNKNEFTPEVVDQSFTVEENSPKGTIIGIVEASDQDEGETTFIIQRITSGWEESTVTWRTQPSITIDNQVMVDGATLPTQDFRDLDVTQLIRDYILDKGSNIKLKDYFYTSLYLHIYIHGIQTARFKASGKLD